MFRLHISEVAPVFMAFDIPFCIAGLLDHTNPPDNSSPQQSSATRFWAFGEFMFAWWQTWACTWNGSASDTKTWFAWINTRAGKDWQYQSWISDGM